MKKISILMILAVMLSSCANAYPIPENSIRYKISGPSLGVGIEPKNKITTKLTPTSETVSNEIRDRVNTNIDAKFKYVIQLEPEKGLEWIKRSNWSSKRYELSHDEKFSYLTGAVVSPNGRYIAVVSSKDKDSTWSKVSIIDTKTDELWSPLSDEFLLNPNAESGCSEMKLVEKINKEDSNANCLVEMPRSQFLIDYWSADNKVEILKQFPSNTIIYSVKVDE